MREIITAVLFSCFIFFFIRIYFHKFYSSHYKNKNALVLDISGKIVDKPILNNKFNFLFNKLIKIKKDKNKENSLFTLVKIIRQAKSDNNISGIVLDLKNLSWADQPSLQYIGKALEEFKNKGKPIYSIGSNYTQIQYFLASYANKIYLTPDGVVDLNGISINNFYYKTLLDKLKINRYIFRIGHYKSAVEPFISNKMSEKVKQMNFRWLNQLWKNYLIIVSKNRKTTPEKLLQKSEHFLKNLKIADGDYSKLALNNGLVDKILSKSNIDNDLIKIFGYNKKNKKFNGVSFYDYKLTNIKKKTNNKISVIFIEGIISNDSTLTKCFNLDKLLQQIENARLDINTKALIFRVNSPGGSVYASESIRREISIIRNIGKPIVVSMGGLAASGGYWVSTPSNYIIANSSTLTGSIGVFGIVNTYEDTLSNFGIYSDGVSTSTLADISATKKLPKDYLKIINFHVENSYKKFIDLISRYRSKNIKEIYKISQGQILIGNDALKNGLVDHLGDFDDAVNKAAELSKLKDFEINWYIDDIKFFNCFIKQSNEIFNLILYEFFINSPYHGLIDIIKFVKQYSEDVFFNCKDPRNCFAICLIKM